MRSLMSGAVSGRSGRFISEVSGRAEVLRDVCRELWELNGHGCVITEETFFASGEHTDGIHLDRRVIKNLTELYGVPIMTAGDWDNFSSLISERRWTVGMIVDRIIGQGG